MKNVLVALLLLAPATSLLTWVRDRNEAVAAGTAAYVKGDANRAVQQFAAALATQAKLKPNPQLVLNLAHAQTWAGRTGAARASYGRLLANTPAPIGSVARQQLAVLTVQQGQLAQALGLLRQALVADPTNAGARYDYEILSAHLARPQPSSNMPAPGSGPKSDAAKKPSPDKSETKNQSATRTGTGRPGEADSRIQTDNEAQAKPQQHNQAGQPDRQQTKLSAGQTNQTSSPASKGNPQPWNSGNRPGEQRGLDRTGAAGNPAPEGRSNQAGTDAASEEDLQLQTQRERLKAMNLTPAQARLVLEALRAQEQQYLQQLPRPAAKKADPTKPTW